MIMDLPVREMAQLISRFVFILQILCDHMYPRYIYIVWHSWDNDDDDKKKSSSTFCLARNVHHLLHLSSDVLLWFLHKLWRFWKTEGEVEGQRWHKHRKTEVCLKFCDLFTSIYLFMCAHLYLPNTCRNAPALTDGTLLLRSSASHS